MIKICMLLGFFSFLFGHKQKEITLYSSTDTTKTVSFKEKDLFRVLEDTSMFLFCVKDSSMSTVGYYVPNASKIFLCIEVNTHNSFFYISVLENKRMEREIYLLQENQDVVLFEKIKAFVGTLPVKLRGDSILFEEVSLCANF